MKKPPLEERKAAQLAKAATLLERLSTEMWRNAVAEAVLRVLRNTGDTRLDDLLAELRNMGAERPRIAISGHSEITIEMKTSEAAIEHLQNALANHRDGEG